MSKHSLKLLLLTVSFLLLAQGLFAKPLDEKDARRVAASFFAAGNYGRLADESAFVLAQTARDNSGGRAYYVFNASDGNGFIVVNATDDSEPVIAYSYDGTFGNGSMPDAATSVLGNVRKYITATGHSPLRKRGVASNAVSGRKLLNTAPWSQEAPFNNLIPNRRLTGCVGIAMSIIMRHHSYPAKGTGSVGSTSLESEYDWTHMRADNYRSGYNAVEAAAVATLVSHAAQSILTDFGMSSSSAFEVRVPSALINHFGYDAGVSYKKRAEMDREAWDNLIVSEIEAGRPVLYSGQDVSAGHAFVCDGYEMRGSQPYFHINWGWGGLANAFFASDALNPSASRDYHFNDQTTIVYNIRPAESAGTWSPIHITSDGGQIGLTADVADMTPETAFTVRAGALKNIANEDFSGSLAVALFDRAGTMKTLVSNPSGFGLGSLQIRQYVDFSCDIPANANIAEGDCIKLVTKANGSDSWLPVAGELIVAGEAAATGYQIPYFSVQMPAATDGVVISATENRVIKGRDFKFNVTSTDADKLVTVRANGFIITPDASGNYRLGNVNSDQTITVTVQNAADVIAKRSLWVTAGNLSSLINEADAGTIKDLTLYGTIDANDFTFIRERMKVERLDLSQTRILANGGNPANAIPAKAFYWYGSLREIKLPSGLTTLKSGCFTGTELTAVEIPASVSTWEYNIFLNCSSLREVTVRRSSPAWINWCVFNGSPKTKLIVPVGSEAAYKAKEYWQDFKEIIGMNPVQPGSYSVELQETEGVKITPEIDAADVTPGSSYRFKVETDDSFGDATMEVYANSTRVYADESGFYTALINANTLIHANFIYPEAVSEIPSTWKITGAAQGAGLVTEVINVTPGKTFSIRANALAIPADDAAMFYAAALTDSKGAIKELISPVITNSSNNYGNLPCTFSCQVKEASVREGNLIRIVTSYNKKTWHAVEAASDDVCDRLKALGNEVRYHSVTMPSSIEGATITGAVSQIAHGMPLTVTVTPTSDNDRVTLSVNGVVKVADMATAKLTVPAVMEDLEIAVQVNPVGTQSYTVVHVNEGELETKIANTPKRLKVVGTISQTEFVAFQVNIAKIEALDLADLTVVKNGVVMTTLPTGAFQPMSVQTKSALKNIILPSSLTSIAKNAFYRNYMLEEITIPAAVTKIDNGAFSTCSKLTKMTMLSAVPCELGTMQSLPSQQVTIEVPHGSLAAYNTAAVRQSEWQKHKFVEAEKIFSISIDQKRVVNADPDNVRLSTIPYPDAVSAVALALPNSAAALNNEQELHPGKAFRIYDNGIDVTETSASIKDGKYFVTFDPAVTDETSLAFPCNHKIDLVLYHSVSFNLASEKISVEMTAPEEGSVWKNVDMSLFDASSSVTLPEVYKEHGSYGFKVSCGLEGMEPKVRIITADGEEQIVIPGDNGVYPITDLQGDVRVAISLVPADGITLDSEDLAAVDADSAADIASIGLSGDVSDKDFETVRENFTNLETLDLSGMQNTSIPADAFTGMNNLSSVIIPDNVTEIGENAFSGCRNLESVSLSSVETIGAGAFSGCSSLTSISISSASGKPTRSAAGISDESFAGVNPNCLIFVPDASLALNGNIIYNANGTRRALGDINLSTLHPFNTPGSFSLAGKTIVLKATVGYNSNSGDDNWSGIILPFAPSSIESAGKKLSLGSKEENMLTALTFVSEDDEVLGEAAAIEANVPYMVRLNEQGAGTAEVTFSASGELTVQATPARETLARTGKDFTLFADYTGHEYVAGDYVLDDKAAGFVPVDTDNRLVSSPFAAYLRASNDTGSDYFAIGTFGEVSSVDSITAGEHNGNVIFREGSDIVIIASEATTVAIHNVAGTLVRTVNLSAGRNTLKLSAGIYIIDGRKVIL